MEKLSTSQLKVAILSCFDFSINDTALHLGLSYSQVNHIKTAIKKKLKVKNDIQLVKACLKLNLIDYETWINS